MTAFTTAWNAAFEADPAESGDVGDGASVIRSEKVAIRERMDVDHYMDLSTTLADQGKHKKVNFIEQTSSPGTPDAGNLVSYAKARENTSGIYSKDDAGLVVTGIDGGCELTRDADTTLDSEWGGYFFMTPTANRIVTLPTTNVRAGWKVFISNSSSTYRLTINASNGNTKCRFYSGWVELIAKQNTPTTPSHWLVLHSSGPGKLIENVTITAVSSVDFAIGFDDTNYRNYLFVFDNLLAAAEVHMRASIDGGSTFPSGGSDYQYERYALILGDPGSAVVGPAAQIPVFVSTSGASSGDGLCGEARVYMPSAGAPKVQWETFGYNVGTDVTTFHGIGQYIGSASAVTAFRFFPDSGNFVSGRISLYGI